MPTLRFWRATDDDYHDAAPGIRVLVNHEDWADGPAWQRNFGDTVRNALMYLNWTPTGQRILRGIIMSRLTVTIQPSPVGNSVMFGNEQALNQVAREVIGGRLGQHTTNALNAAGIRPQAQAIWLHRVIVQSPEWTLGVTPGTDRGYWAMVETAKQKLNTYWLWSDSGEGSFNDKRWFGTWGVSAFRNSITMHEVAGWLQGQALPVRLNERAKNHAKLATIVALRAHSARNVGSQCDVAWNCDPAYEMNTIRPPAVGLGHELIHAFYSCRGEQCGRDVRHYSTALFEYQCVGLGPWDEAFPSENSLRREWGAISNRLPFGDTQNRKVPNKRIKYD